MGRYSDPFTFPLDSHLYKYCIKSLVVNKVHHANLFKIILEQQEFVIDRKIHKLNFVFQIEYIMFLFKNQLFLIDSFLAFAWGTDLIDQYLV